MEATIDKNNESTRQPQEQQNRPECYGNAQHVCPRDEEGVMQPCVECLPCEFLKGCLQLALQKQGLIPTPILETPVVSRVSRFFKRWSDQKLASTKNA
jgi:hypothetical protein